MGMYWLVGLVGCADFANTKLIDNRRSAISVQLLHRADVSQEWVPHPSPECAKNRKTGALESGPLVSSRHHRTATHHNLPR